MEVFTFLFFYSLIMSFTVFEFGRAADTITLNETITGGETLVSSGQSFELGFFSPSSSTNQYLGIWYKNFPEIVVWIANREFPVRASYGVLTISSDGNLVLHNGTKSSVIWSSISSGAVQNPIAQLLDSGNFVIRERSEASMQNYIWQSFDFPTDTLLPGMKMGWNLVSGLNRYLTSWKDSSDPSPGNFTYRIDILGLPQVVLREGSEKKFRSGEWNGLRFSGTSLMSNPVFKPNFVTNNEELYYMFESGNNSIISRLMLDISGWIHRYVLNEGSSEWDIMYAGPNDRCENYGRCGANAICRINRMPICECLVGFTPESQRHWDVLDFSGGCIRRTPLGCQKGAGFLQLKNMKLPDLLDLGFWLNKSMNLKECMAECLRNCSCTAYANSDISGSHSGCLIWFGDLIDIREFTEESSEQDIYIRILASELDHNQKEKRLVLIIVLSTAPGMLVLCLVTWFMIRKRKNKRGTERNKEDIELPLFDLATITKATNNFSCTNMIGQGGFGTVYKLSTGQEIAVKRLSANSGQGLQEFKNEIILISKLQHRNLVRLLGCCLEGEERMLVYEYMPNKSLDYLIFDQNRRALLTWQNRFEIAMGIAKGLLYLHHDSRLRVIHRDLKTSNILLDSELNPKISDFGIARIFGGDQIEAKTKRVVGTYGYMSPEYAIDGKFSVKSDVFSFSVLLLEMVSGKRNTRYHSPDHYHSLLGHAWLLWNEGKALELMDEYLEDSYVESQVLRCIQVSLLCIQKFPNDRPTMSLVVSMLGTEGVPLPQPKQPGFFIERSSIETDMLTGEERLHSENAVTITMPEAR